MQSIKIQTWTPSDTWYQTTLVNDVKLIDTQAISLDNYGCGKRIRLVRIGRSFLTSDTTDILYICFN